MREYLFDLQKRQLAQGRTEAFNERIGGNGDLKERTFSKFHPPPGK